MSMLIHFVFLSFGREIHSPNYLIRVFVLDGHGVI